MPAAERYNTAKIVTVVITTPVLTTSHDGDGDGDGGGRCTSQ